MQEPLVSRILKYALYVAFAVGIIMTITLPITIDYYARIIGIGALSASYRAFILPFLLIVYSVHSMLMGCFRNDRHDALYS